MDEVIAGTKKLAVARKEAGAKTVAAAAAIRSQAKQESAARKSRGGTRRGGPADRRDGPRDNEAHRKLQEERFEKSAAILEAFHKEYYDMRVWDGVAHEIRMRLKTLGRHLENPPPFDLAAAVKVLIEQHGYDNVSDAVLEHNP